MIGTMMMPPICCATRGSLTRELTITPGHDRRQPDGRPEHEDAGQPARVGHDPEQVGPVDDRRERDEHDDR